MLGVRFFLKISCRDHPRLKKKLQKHHFLVYKNLGYYVMSLKIFSLLFYFQIAKLRNERNTLRLVHNNLVALLNKQCMETDHVISEKIKHSSHSDEALLLQEVN